MQHLQQSNYSNKSLSKSWKTGLLLKTTPVFMGLIILTIAGCGSSRVQKLETEKNVPELIAILQKNNSSSDDAAIALGNLGDRKAVEPLIAALKSDNKEVAKKAAIALGKIKDIRAAQPLIAVVNSSNYKVRPAAQQALASIITAHPQLMKPLLPQLNKQITAMTGVFGKIGTPAVNPLIAKLKDTNRFARINASIALGEIGDSKAINSLVQNLTDPASNKHVAKALTKLKWQPNNDTDRVHFLVASQNGEQLRDNWATTRKVLLADIQSKDYRKITNSLYAFINLGDQEVIPNLVNILKTKGNKNMALAYLNSREVTLEGAARRWAKQRGFRIVRSVKYSSAQNVKWGGW